MKSIRTFYGEKRYKEPFFKRIALVILAFVVMVGSSSVMASNMISNRLRGQAEAVVTQAVKNIEADFTGPMTAVNIASDTIREMIMQGADAEAVRAYLADVSDSLHEQRFGLALGRMYGYFDAFEGGLFLEPQGMGREADFDPSMQPWYEAAIASEGKLGMTQVFFSEQFNGEAVSFARRIFDKDGLPLGVVSLDIPFEQLRTHISQLHFSGEMDGSYGFLMNENLEMIAHPDPAFENAAMHDWLSAKEHHEDRLQLWLQHNQEEDNQLIEYGMKGEETDSVMACSAKMANGWILTLVTPFMEYYGDLIRMQVVLFLLAGALAAVLISMLVRLNKRTAERDEQYNKLVAVAQNYKGIMWSVDSKGILTTLRGQYMRKLRLNPADFEGRPMQVAEPCLPVNFIDYIEKTQTEGPQDWTFESDDITYYSYMALTYDDKGRPAGIVGSIDDITEQAMLQQRLEDALAEAEIANKAKSSFLANMSHEIRTPMNAILGITEILVQDETLPASVMEGLVKIYNSCDLLLGIINDVLDFSKIEAGKLDITPASYKVASLVNDSVHLNMMRIGSKPIEFTLQIDEKIPAKLIGDELRIKQILNNLLSNAFKYTDEGKIVLQVGFERKGENRIALILEVRDTGRGMTKQQIDKLFDEYTRFQSERGRTVEGTGLGMAITRSLLHLMDGDIHLESEPGRGSRFVVSLPQGTVDEEELGMELAENLSNFKTNFITNRERVQIVRDPMPYGKVLVVDDVETNIYVASGLFKLYSLQVDTAMSGYEVIDKIKAGNVYDIVFMDHMMPGMDGIEATRQIRDLGYEEPIVALTANAVTKNANLFLQNGFDNFIAKPIDIRQLNSVLNKLVRDKQPPEVIEEARRQKEAQPVSEGSETKTELDPMLLSSFVRDARKAVAALDEWYSGKETASQEQLQQFTITVHGMKTALANIREMALAALAKELELAGKSGDLERINQSTPEFLDKLRLLIERGASGEDHEDGQEDTSVLREKFKAVREMCEDYDRKGAADILAELGKGICSRQTREVIERIMEAVLHSDFEEAGEMAGAYADSLPAQGLHTATIEGLDIARGLDRYDGDEEIYTKILRSYISSMDRLLDEAQTVGEETLKDYEIAVHGMKGASRDIFAESIGRQAAALEDAAKAGDLGYIRQSHAAFQDAVRLLSAEIAQTLAQIEAQRQKPKKDKPDGDMLSKLVEACEVYDMDGVDTALAQINAYEYEEDEGLALWLQEKADLADFEAIVQKLTEQNTEDRQNTER